MTEAVLPIGVRKTGSSTLYPPGRGDTDEPAAGGFPVRLFGSWPPVDSRDGVGQEATR